MQTSIEQRYLSIKRRLFDKAFAELNERQREAVFTVNNPLLILAGAGSGKTTVLVRRIAFIIRYGNAYFSDYVPYGTDEARIAELAEQDIPPPERSANAPARRRLPVFGVLAAAMLALLALLSIVAPQSFKGASIACTALYFAFASVAAAFRRD